MTTIHRLSVDVGAEFQAPMALTFGWQEPRQSFSVWFRAGDPPAATYAILGTGHGYHKPFDLVATVVLPDGFHAFHLVRLRG